MIGFPRGSVTVIREVQMGMTDGSKERTHHIENVVHVDIVVYKATRVDVVEARQELTRQG